MNSKIYRNKGRIVTGIKTPIIKPGDDLQEIVISSVVEQIGEENFDDGDIIGITEAVVAIVQSNFVTHQNISDDIANKFVGAKTLVIVDPIQSRNRFIDVLKAIAKTPTLEKIYIVFTYPSDEMGNELLTDIDITETDINPYQDVLTVSEFYSKLGKPEHPFTGKNYIEEYINACEGKAEIILCNNFSKIPLITKCDDFLVCSIHRREKTIKYLKMGGAKRVLDLSQIMDKPIDDSGYNKEFGVYGSNLMSGNRLKLMPRDCQKFVNEIKDKFWERYGYDVDVFVFGDGAFKDPVGGIWELADPQATLGETDRLRGTPKEVKLKYIASANDKATPEEIEELVAKESKKRKATDDITGELSLGTTPRRITDLLASLADLTTGSGDKQTPVVYIKNYF